MNTRIKNIFTKAVDLLIVALMVMLTINQCVFIHTHKLADGTIIVHAHPFNKKADSSPIKHHHHSGTELMVLQNLHLLFLSVFVVIALLNLSFKVRFYTETKLRFVPRSCNSQTDRAPPVLG